VESCGTNPTQTLEFWETHYLRKAPTPKKLRILIADDHEVVRHGLCVVLQTCREWEVCGQAVDGRDAVAKARELSPDLVILDFRMPRLSGLEAARNILQDHPTTEILILTLDESESMVHEALSAGIRGLLFKSDCVHDLVTAVETLCHHKRFFSPKIMEMVVDLYLSSKTPPPGIVVQGRLTAREREILQLLAEGDSSKDVAATLALSTKTVETHRSNIMRKLDCHSVSQLTLYAIRNNLACLPATMAATSLKDAALNESGQNASSTSDVTRL